MTGRREQARARTRAAIIEAGVRLMHADGYDRTSTSAIARAAGVSPATLFNYFPTKASILFADDALWSPRGLDVTPQPTPRATLAAAMRTLMARPEWTRAADDELTRMRFELVQRESALVERQAALAVSTVPDFADLACAAHPGLDRDEALVLAGGLVGAVVAALLWGPPDVPAALARALAGWE